MPKGQKMKKIYITLIGILTITLSSLIDSKEAKAFVCVPTLYNCWCTYNFPCPSPQPSVIPLTQQILEKAREGEQIIGEVDGSLEGISTPLSDSEISSTTYTSSSQLLKGIFAREKFNDPLYSPRQTWINLPEHKLEENLLPKVSATTRIDDDPKTIEAYGNAHQRTKDVLTVNDINDRDGINIANSNYKDILYKNSMNAYARSLIMKPKLPMLLDYGNQLENHLTRTKHLPEDIAINSLLKLENIILKAELTEMANLWLTLKSLDNLNKNIQPKALQIKSEEGKFISAEEAERIRLSNEVALAAAEVNRKTQEAKHAHNALTSLKQLIKEKEELYPYIKQHEDRKAHLFATESSLKGTLNWLYIDGNSAWNKLKKDLKADSTSYANPNRFDVAKNLSRKLDMILTAQSELTDYGRRRPNPQCSPLKAQQGECVPFTENPWTGSDPAVSMINSYYTNPLDRYKISANAIGTGTSENPIPADTSSYVLMQYYLEANKRGQWWGNQRRGVGRTMTSELWNELKTQEPSCFIGPIASNVSNLNNYPEYFDIDPNCPHRRWTSGNKAGEKIHNSNLNGMDRTIFSINQAIDLYNEDYKGRPEVEQLVQEATSVINQSQYKFKAQQIEQNNRVTEANQYELMLRQIYQDDSNSNYVNF